MTTKVVFRPDGFTVTGLKRAMSHPAARELHIALPVMDMGFAALNQTALYITCHRPQRVWLQMQEILNRWASEGDAYLDWQQQVRFIALDAEMVAVCFETELPPRLYVTLLNEPHMCDLVSDRTAVIMRRTDTTDEQWSACQKQIWRHIQLNGMADSESKTPPYHDLPAMGEQGQVVGLDESLVAVRSPTTIPDGYSVGLTSDDLCLTVAGLNTVLLKRSRFATPEPPGQPLEPTLFRYHVAVGRALHLLAETAFIGTEAPFITI
jgi:hypothetical protein